MHSRAEESTAEQRRAQHSKPQQTTAQHSKARHSTAQHTRAQHGAAQHAIAQQSTQGDTPVSTTQHNIACHDGWLRIDVGNLRKGNFEIVVFVGCLKLPFLLFPMVRELGFRRTVISGTLPFRRQHQELIFGNVLGETHKNNSEGTGGRRPTAPSEVILVNRPKHCRKLTPGAASEMAKYLKSLFAEIPIP